MDTKTNPYGISNTHVNSLDMHHMRKLVDSLVSSPTVRNSVQMAISQGRSPHATPFERYMSRVLVDAGGNEFIHIGVQANLQLVPPGDGHLAQIVYRGALEENEKGVVVTVQDAINRLCSMVDALEDSADLEDPHGRPTITISILGGAFKPDRPLYRSAHVHLPAIGPNEQPSFNYLNEVDWRALEHVPVIARAVFQSSMLPNMHQGLMGAYAPTGSDWDVRTRLASILNKLELPLSCNFSFDCNVEADIVAVRFSVPPLRSFPQLARDTATGAIRDCAPLLHAAQKCYSIRLACLLAAGGFGAGRHISFVEIECHDEGRFLMSCGFNRHDFVHITLTALESLDAFEQSLRFDPDALTATVAPAHISWAPCEAIAKEHCVEAPINESVSHLLSSLRIDTHEDTRPLPENLVRLFHASRICDIDTVHFHGGKQDSIEDARLDSNDSILMAIAQLEHTISELEEKCVPPNDDAAARPLFCSNPLSRAVVSLLDDSLSVSLEAEDYLRGAESNTEGFDAPERLPRYFRAPDALFQAHVGLSDLYSRLGDYRGAESEADRCLALAPTTAQAYFLKADALAQQDRYVEAANILMAGLRVAVSERDCALLYYHLGLVLWKLDRKQEAVSVHVYTMSLAGEYAEKSAKVIRTLRQRKNMPVIVHASPLAATREMTRARIPIAPSDEARTLVVQACIGLSCANAPLAAAPYATALMRYFRNDEIISATADSIRHGIQ